MSAFTLILFIAILSSNLSENVKFSLNQIPIELKSILCQDGNSSCPSSETCCQLQSGQNGCCPLHEGVCCNDHLHCCPNGYQCDLQHSICQKQSKQSDHIKCPDDQMSCANGETCWKSQFGDYGCCPLPDAVSCSDLIHCCPHGYRCDIGEEKCQKGISIPWFTKKSATPLDIPSKLIMSSPLSSSLSTVQCEDKKSICSKERSCCELNNGTYGCCPYRQASCCSDKIHCCSEGYSCDQSGSKCLRHLSLIPLSIIEEQICSDGITKCSSSSTCCQNKDQTSSCCSYAQGVCCGSSCCPSKYICDENNLTCQLNETISNENEDLNQRRSSDVDIEFTTTGIPQSCSPPALGCGAGDICCPNKMCCQPGCCMPTLMCQCPSQ